MKQNKSKATFPSCLTHKRAAKGRMHLQQEEQTIKRNNISKCLCVFPPDPFSRLMVCRHLGIWTSFTYTSENKFQLKFKPKKSCSGWTLNVSSVRMSLPSFKAFVLLNRIYIFFYFYSNQSQVSKLFFLHHPKV